MIQRSSFYQLHAPDFLLLEMDSILCKWLRRGVIAIEEALEVRKAFRRYPIWYHPVASFLDAAFAVANETGKSIYDSLYLALAILLEGRMVTADRKFYEALQAGPFDNRPLWMGDLSESGL